LEKLDDAKATGRLVIDLPKLLSADNSTDITLQDGDSLVIPQSSHEVSVLGEVQFPTSHLHQKRKNVFDYIQVSGGLTSKADKKRIYVIKENGEIKAVKRTALLFYRRTRVAAGDTVIVPYDIYSMSNTSYWMNISQVLFNLSTTVAALKSVDAF